MTAGGPQSGVVLATQNHRVSQAGEVLTWPAALLAAQTALPTRNGADELSEVDAGGDQAATARAAFQVHAGLGSQLLERLSLDQRQVTRAPVTVMSVATQP